MISLEIKLADPVILARLSGNPQLLAICCTRINVFIAMWPNVLQSEFLRECWAESTGFLEDKVDCIFQPKLVNECFIIGVFDIANAPLGTLKSMRRSKENYRLPHNLAPFDKIHESAGTKVPCAEINLIA